MAHDLFTLGITVNCAPVLDVPQPGSHEVIGERAYGDDPKAVTALAGAVAEGLRAGGVLPVIKHIPGHGRARADSHFELPLVEARADALRAVDFAPFRALRDQPMAMTAHVVYTAFDADNPATLSRPLVHEVMRRQIGFDGLIMSDDLSMKALSGDMGERVARARAAGIDMMLHCNGKLSEMEQVAEAAGRLSGIGLARAQAALAAATPPRDFDRAGAEAARARIATAR